ncbi:MAG: hypothetical protein K0R11_1361, partial [Acidimicrobiales bacterium]|nr:hypothetical protein [Acidimicrobiales bacterium]
MWRGLPVAGVGSTGLWDPSGSLHLTGDRYEAVVRWLMRPEA